jgi:putative transposase
MRAIARERRRFGYRRLHVLLKREGYLINHKKLFRLYREEKLAVRRRGGRKRSIGTRAPMTMPMAPNDRWSLDFVSDQLTDGRRFRILTVVVGDRHLALWHPRGARIGPADDRARQAEDGGQ